MWMDVNVTLPNIGDKVLICYTAFGQREYAEAEYVGDSLFRVRDSIKVATHWSPHTVPTK